MDYMTLQLWKSAFSRWQVHFEERAIKKGEVNENQLGVSRLYEPCVIFDNSILWV